MPGIGVISNPRSGRNRKNPELVERLAYVLGEQGELAQPDGLDRLEAVAQHFKERDIDVLCISGGDGTLHKVLSAFVRTYASGLSGRELRSVRLPLVAILKSGTVNTMARNVGLKSSGEELLGRVVAWYHVQRPFKTVERNVMVINGEQAGFLFGTGVLARFMEAYYDGGDTGPWKGFKVLSRAVASAMTNGPFAQALFAPEPSVVRVEGQAWEHPAYAAVAAGTMADIGLGFRVFHQAPRHPDHMHLYGFPGGPMSVVRCLPRFYMGWEHRQPDVIDQVVRRFTIERETGAGYMLDGDFLPGGQSLTVEVGPRVRFIID